MTLSLAELVAALPEARLRGSAETPVEAITHDSRRVRPGSLFVAYQGVAVDGHAFIPAALEQGAAAVVAEREVEGLPVPLVQVPDGREALAYLSAAWQGYPARSLVVVGVTGTDGKTTTCNLLHSILCAAGRRAGLVTTVNAVIGERVQDTGLHTTTPDAPDMQRYLADMVEAGMELAVVEATSEGLAQHRVTASDFDLAVVTNITHEHLYFHGSLEAYQQAKAKLFHHLAGGYRKPGVPKVAVLNRDDASYAYLRPIPADRYLVYGLASQADASGFDGSAADASGTERAPADVVALDMRVSVADTPAAVTSAGDVRFVLRGLGHEFVVRTRLVGDYNVSNILAAATAALALGVPPEAIQAGVWNVEGITGRMERVDEGQDFVVLVDFAHTPNALQRALETARTLTDGRVIAVFGCAGERDVQKRAWMGEISARLADVTVMTAEDPRRESLEEILDEMARGAEAAGAVLRRDYFRVPDRAEAIQFAVDLARPGDLVIACGKGHEQSMCYGAEERPWSEHAALRAALRRLARGE